MNSFPLQASMSCAFKLVLITMLLLVSTASLSAEQPEKTGIADVPKDTKPLIDNFLAVLNSARTWEMAPLMRPDQSQDEAIAAFLKSNPGFAIIKNNTQNPVKPIMDKDKYVFWQYLKPNERTWILVYGRVFQDQNKLRPSQSESALWVKSGTTWRLAGYGWPLDLSRAEAERKGRKEHNGNKGT